MIINKTKNNINKRYIKGFYLVEISKVNKGGMLYSYGN